ncbi:hypothetical protein JCM30471_29420 [Desulfuromonas carbonis]
MTDAAMFHGDFNVVGSEGAGIVFEGLQLATGGKRGIGFDHDTDSLVEVGDSLSVKYRLFTAPATLPGEIFRRGHELPRSKLRGINSLHP